MEAPKRRIIKARVPMELTFEQQLMVDLLKKICILIPTSLPVINRRCPAYEKGKNTQAKPINENFENLVGDAVRNMMTDRGYSYGPAYLEHRSDVSLETDDFILQVDAKGVLVLDSDNDFKVCKEGLKVRCGEAQTSITIANTDKKGVTKTWQGLQMPVIEGKPVYTLLAFMRWGYSTETKYYIESCGVAIIPHDSSAVKPAGGKNSKELRFFIESPSLYRVHQFASESPSRIPDSAQQECNDVPATSQQSQ